MQRRVSVVVLFGRIYASTRQRADEVRLIPGTDRMQQIGICVRVDLLQEIIQLVFAQHLNHLSHSGVVTVAEEVLQKARKGMESV